MEGQYGADEIARQVAAALQEFDGVGSGWGWRWALRMVLTLQQKWVQQCHRSGLKAHREWWNLLMEGGYQRYMQDDADYTEARADKAVKVAHFRQICADLAGSPLQGRTLIDELQALSLLQGNLGTHAAPCVGDGSLLPWRQTDLLGRHLDAGAIMGSPPPPAARPAVAPAEDVVELEVVEQTLQDLMQIVQT